MVIAPALVELGLLVIVLWVIAFVALLAVILGYVAGVLHGLPYPINQLAGPVDRMAAGLSSAVGKAFTGVEKAVAWSWHIMARLLDHTWTEFRLATDLQETTTKVVATHGAAINKLSAQWRSERAKIDARRSQVSTIERELVGIEHGVKSLERELHKGIGSDVRVHVKALEKALGRIEKQTIPAIQAKDTTFTGEISNLYDWAKGKAALLGIGTFATAVATAIGLDVFKLLQCNELGTLAKNYGCNMWARLARFLPFLGLLALAFDFPEFVKAAEFVAEEIGPSVASIEGAVLSALPPLPPPN